MTDTILDTISAITAALATARKALVPLVAAAYIILGTDSPVLADVVAVLTALGVYSVPNSA